MSTLDTVFDTGLGYSNSWRPQVTGLTSPFSLSNSFSMTGSQFRSVSEGSSGNGSQNSTSDLPVVQLLGIGNEETLFLSSTNWQTNSFVSLPVTNFPPGYAQATMFVNGTPSTSSIVRIGTTPTSFTLNRPTKAAKGALQFTFTNTPGAVFNVLASTNASTPLTNWTVLSNVTETTDGHFSFTDTQATNFARRFYRVVSP